MVSRNRVIASNYQYRLVDELFVYLDQVDSPYKDEPSIQVYASLFKMLSQQTDQHYQSVLQKLTIYADQFSIFEQRSIYDFVLNYLIGKYNQNTGQTSYLDEILNLYKVLVKGKIIYINDHLPPWEYKTIVTTAISLGYLEWTQDFIETYKEDLPSDSKDHSYAYNMAYYKYMIKDYKGALLALYDINFNDWRYYTGAKMIQLRSYFELDEEEALLSLVDTFRVYLNRKGSIPENHKLLYRNFIKFAAKLYKIKSGFELKRKGTDQSLNSILKQIQQENVASKAWLLDTIKKIQHNAS